MIPNGKVKEQTLGSIAGKLAETGDMSGAKATARMIFDEQGQGKTMAKIAKEQAGLADNTGARSTASMISDPSDLMEVDVSTAAATGSETTSVNRTNLMEADAALNEDMPGIAAAGGGRRKRRVLGWGRAG